MADAIGQVLAFGLGVGLSPIPIIAVVLMLGTPRARVNGPAFVLGWIVGLALVGTIVLVVAGGAGATEGEDPATWVSVLMLVLGAVLLLVWRCGSGAGARAVTRRRRCRRGCGRSTTSPRSARWRSRSRCPP